MSMNTRQITARKFLRYQARHLLDMLRGDITIALDDVTMATTAQDIILRSSAI